MLLWTGERIIVFGGDANVGGRETTPTNAGAAYDPESAQWTEMAAPPFAPLASPQAVWTGKDVVTLGVQCEVVDQEGGDSTSSSCAPGTLAAAAYDPKKNRWTELEAPRDASVDVDASSPTNVEAIGWDGKRAVFRVNADLWALKNKKWQKLERPQAGVLGGVSCVSSSSPLTVVHLARADSDVIVSEDAAPPIAPSATMLDKRGRWTEPVYAATSEVVATPLAVCSGTDVVLLSAEPNANGDGFTRFDAVQGEWLDLPAPPFDVTSSVIGLPASAGPLVASAGFIGALDIQSGAWNVVEESGFDPGLIFRSTIADDALVALVRHADTTTSLVAYDIP